MVKSKKHNDCWFNGMVFIEYDVAVEDIRMIN